jgi:hypothetical protein
MGSVGGSEKATLLIGEPELKAFRRSTEGLRLTKYWLENGKIWLKPLDDFDTT